MSELKQSRSMRSAVKKSFILDKAGQLFWQKGYHSTSMKDVADACNCRPANIYHYFKSKEDILYEVIRDITERTVASIRHLENDEVTSPADQIKSFVKSHLGLLSTMNKSNILISDTGLRDLTPEHRKAIVELRDTYDSILCKVLRRGINSGDFANIDERVISYFISSVIIRSNISFSSKGRLSQDDIVNSMSKFIYVGIKTRKYEPRPT
jgi:TetR/AcrR family transcriptional regulator, cholesterol catabolism regulator